MITEYSNNTAFFIVVKQSDGSTYELNPGMSVKADKGTHFTAIKYQLTGKKWHILNQEKIRMYN